MILHGDCLEKLKEIPDNSVDAVVTDPPYGIDYQSAWRIDKKDWKPKIANDKRPFIWWLYDAFRVVKEGGSLVCFCRWDVQQDFKSAIENAGFNIKSQIIWDREVHGMGDLKASFAPQHDVIWFAVKGKFEFPGKRPKSVIRSQRIGGGALVHPNEKPVDLMEQLLSAVVPQNGTALDPFAGSGSTLVAAKNLGFKFIGIEREAEYIEIIKGRLNERHQVQAVQATMEFVESSPKI